MRAFLTSGVRCWPVAVLLGLAVVLPSRPATAAVIESKKFQLAAAKPATPPAFPKRNTPLPDPRRYVHRWESRPRDDDFLPAPIRPLPPGFKGLATPPPAKSVAKIARSVLDFSNTIDLLTNRALKDEETNKQTTCDCEPTVAVRGDEVLLTANLFTAFSKDGGQTFKFIEPRNAFPFPDGAEFICDQVAHYDRRTDTMFWLMQYVWPEGSRVNILRLAVAHGDDIAKENWRYYDLSPKGVGGWEGEWFDYPDLAVGSKFLYLTVNLFTAEQDSFKRVLVVRLPLDELAKGGECAGDYFALAKSETESSFSLRPTQGATGTMHFACHFDPATIRVFSWPESGTEVSYQNVGVQVWRLPKGRGDYEAAGPDGRPWLNKADPRITAAWAAKGNLGFAWTAPQDDNYPFPHVRCVILDEAAHKVVAEPPLWSKEYALAYPAAAPSADGTVGISVAYGGDKLHPSHAVGVLRPAAGTKDWKWELLSTAAGTDGPGNYVWGDYLAVRPHGKEPAAWAATGFTLQGGSESDKIQVRYLRFRVKSD